jgi:hypothetical protein
LLRLTAPPLERHPSRAPPLERPYELGGIALLDLRTHAVVNEFPFQCWSEAGHVMTRNPLKLSADGNVITMWAAPDDGDEGAGTEIYTWQATPPHQG